MKMLLAAIAAVLVAAAPARADEASFRAAQDTIGRQIEAFLADDDTLAYSLAAPSIQRMFPTREIFMRMVQNGYPMVHRPGSYAFGAAEMTGPGAVTQRVLIAGRDGRTYEAVYTLELQPDGIYRITGVSLRASEALGA